MIEIGINSELLRQILDGRKTVEGRLARGKFITIQPGDLVSIREDVYKDGFVTESHNTAALIKIVDVGRFRSFQEMLEHYDYRCVIPSAKSLSDACREYNRYYSSANEKEHGVLGISFQLLSS